MSSRESLTVGQDTRRSTAAAIGLTTLTTAAGYAVTLIQQGLYSRSLGVNTDTDALAAALAWAVGTTGLIGTTLATVFLPIYVRVVRREPDRALTLRAGATTIALGVGTALVIGTVLGAPWLAQVLAPGITGPRQEVLIGLLRLGSPLEVTWLLVWLTVATVNAHERYVLAAASSMLPPLPVIGVLISGEATTTLVIAAYVVGTILQLVLLWAIDRQSTPILNRAIRSIRSHGLGSGLAPVGISFGLLTVVPLEVRALASFVGAGGVATADYASRLVLAGQQVLLSGLLAVTFTRWSAGAVIGSDGPRIVSDSVRRTLLLVLLAGVATTIVLPIAAVEITRLILAGGRFTGADAVAVGRFVGWMAPGVGAHMVLMVAARALLAEERFSPLIGAAAASVGVLFAVGTLTLPLMGLDGIAAGYSAGYVAAAAIALVAMFSTQPGSSNRPISTATPLFMNVPAASELAVTEKTR